MYRILVVDDEKWIRRGVVNKINAFFPGKCEVESAPDGAAALSLLRERAFDLLVTDIRMPKLDGIELARTARAECAQLECVIISGYADFVYAEQALNMGVAGYILKPIQDEQLTETLQKVFSRIDDERHRRRMDEDIAALEEDRRLQSLIGYLNTVLKTPRPQNVPAPAPPEGAAALLALRYFTLLMLNVDYSTYDKSQFRYQDIFLIRYGIQNIAEECAERYGFGQVLAFPNLTNENQVFVLLGHAAAPALAEKSDRYLLRIYNTIEKSLGVTLTIAMSAVCEGLSNTLYRQVRECFDLRLLRGTGKFYRYSDMQPAETLYFPSDKLNLLKSSMERYDFKNIDILLRSILSAQNFSSLAQAKSVYSAIVNTLIRVCIKLSINIENAIDSDIFSDEMLNNFETMEELADFTCITVRKLLNHEDLSYVKGDAFNARVLEYIEKNYCDDLTVKDVAAKFAVSPNYFSTVFSRANGTTFTQYLINTRIQRACVLLRETDLPIDRIAVSVGFNDARYFYRVFKRTVGRTPADYRARSV